jgi:hypothetical protein
MTSRRITRLQPWASPLTDGDADADNDNDVSGSSKMPSTGSSCIAEDKNSPTRRRSNRSINITMPASPKQELQLQQDKEEAEEEVMSAAAIERKNDSRRQMNSSPLRVPLLERRVLLQDLLLPTKTNPIARSLPCRTYAGYVHRCATCDVP